MSQFSQGETERDVEEEELGNLTSSIDAEDYNGCSLDDAIQDHMDPPKVDWPNDIYREFMEIVTEYRLSNSCGDRIIKWFNASTNFKESSLLASIKQGMNFWTITIFHICFSKKYLLLLFKMSSILYIIAQ